MKVKITTLVLFMFCVIHVNAQQKTDGFFSYKYSARATNMVNLTQVSEIGFNNMNMNEESVPLGNGLLVLTVISTSYLVLKGKEVKK